MNQLICDAIRDKRLLTFVYKGKPRVVEPHTLGVDERGHDTLCAWQLSGGSGVGFRDFHVAQMSNLNVSADRFCGPRGGFRRGDSTMSSVICEL